MTTDAYAYWRACATGSAWSLSPSEADAGQPGRWRLKRKHGGPYDRLAIWPDMARANVYYHKFNDEKISISTGLPQIRGFAFALFASGSDYDYHAANGVWPGEVPGLISNAKEITNYDQLRDNINELSRDAMKWAEAHPNISTQEECDVAANYRTSLNHLITAAKAAQKEEYAPLKKVADDCRKQWESITTKAATASTTLINIAEPFLVAQKREADKAAAKEAAKLAAERRELEDIDITLAALLPVEKPKAVKVSAGGQTGRRMGLRVVYTAVVDDYSLALAHFANHSKVIDLINTLAQAEARSKDRSAIPGVRFVESEKAI